MSPNLLHNQRFPWGVYTDRVRGPSIPGTRLKRIRG